MRDGCGRVAPPEVPPPPLFRAGFPKEIAPKGASKISLKLLYMDWFRESQYFLSQYLSAI